MWYLAQHWDHEDKEKIPYNTEDNLDEVKDIFSGIA